MATSTIPAVKDAILTLLKAWPALDGVQIKWARPSEDAIRKESIWFEGTKSQQRAEAMGNQRRDETFIHELVVSVLRDGDEPRGCELRMWELVAEVETVVRQNPRPMPAPLLDIQYAGADQVPHQAEGQRCSEALVRIAARSRI